MTRKNKNKNNTLSAATDLLQCEHSDYPDVFAKYDYPYDNGEYGLCVKRFRTTRRYSKGYTIHNVPYRIYQGDICQSAASAMLESQIYWEYMVKNGVTETDYNDHELIL